MRKGLTVTLLTVAIAILGSNAMSMAPLIGNIKDIIVADDAPVSGGNHFVYPNAVDTATAASDDTTSPGGIIWTFLESTGTYVINGAASLAGAEDPNSPPAAKIVTGPGSTSPGDPDDSDGKATLTFRNANLSPIGGSDTDPGVTGIVAAQTRALTLFASDSDLADSVTLFVYTDNDGGPDRLSPAGAPVIAQTHFDATANNWTFVAGAGVTSSQDNATGICLTTPAAGDNIGSWFSPYGYANLVDNTVLEIHLQLSTTQTADSAIPLWDFIVANNNLANNPNGSIGANTYFGDFFYLDNIGGSQGIGRANGRSEFIIYFTPPPVDFANWRSTSTGAFQSAADPFNDMAFGFRTLDLASGGWNAANDSGTLCLSDITIAQWSLDNMVRGATIYSDTSLATGDFHMAIAGTGGTLSFNGGKMRIAPTTGTSWNTNIDSITPGASNSPSGTGLPINDQTVWPLPWQSDKILLMEYDTSAPTVNDQQHLGDLIVGMIAAGGAETYQESFTLPNIKFLGSGTAGAGAPPVAPASGKYKAFAYTNHQSNASDFNFLQPRIDIQNFPQFSDANPTGAMDIGAVTVQEVTFQ